jgi:hypothetical protein
MWEEGDILRAVNGAASLHRGNPACCRSVSGLPLPRSAGRISTLARERPVALPRGLPSTGKSLPRGFSTRLSPLRSNLTVHLPAPVTPFDRARGAPSPWVVDGPTPVVTSHRGLAEPVWKVSTQEILNVGVPAGHCPVVCGTELTRFTPAVNGGILSLSQEINLVCLLESRETRHVLQKRGVSSEPVFTFEQRIRAAVVPVRLCPLACVVGFNSSCRSRVRRRSAPRSHRQRPRRRRPRHRRV